MNKDLEIIEGRIEVLFKKVLETQYHIDVVNDRFDHAYNFFFQSQPQHQRIKSVPLHTYQEYDLSKLPKDMVKVDKDRTIHFNAENITENEDGKSNSVSFNDDKKGDEKSTPAETVTKEAVVKMAQTEHSNSVFDKIINYFMGK